MTNKQRIIEAAKAHRAGANAHKFNTAFGWKKAGFCPRTSAKFTARLCFKTPKGFVWKDEPIYRDDQVVLAQEASAQAKPKASAEPKKEAVKASAKPTQASAKKAPSNPCGTECWLVVPKNAHELERHYYRLCKDRKNTSSPARKIAYALASELRARRLATANA